MKKSNFPLFTKPLIFCIICFLVVGTTIAQSSKTGKNRKVDKADELLEKAIALGDSAKYDSAVVVLNEVCLLYKKKNNIDKYIQCKNEIVKQSRYIYHNGELLGSARENLSLAINKLGIKHTITANSYSLLGNVFADINKLDSALIYFKKAKEIWELRPVENKLKIAAANLNIGQMLGEKGEFKQAKALIYSS
jgi:tetratricopeptide (TPR) repeat protein